jgi:hypothetical protein
MMSKAVARTRLIINRIGENYCMPSKTCRIRVRALRGKNGARAGEGVCGGDDRPARFPRINPLYPRSPVPYSYFAREMNGLSQLVVC